MSVEREAVRLCLTKAGLTVKRKNAATEPAGPHIILTDLEDGILLSVGGATSTGEVTGTSSKAHLAVQRAGFKVRCDTWGTTTVTDHA